jgi:alpha/beta superfamily hydrolase
MRKRSGCQDRSGDGRRPSPLVIGLGALLAGAGFALGTLAYAYSATHPGRRRVRCTPERFGLPHEEVTFPTTDGLRISGWLIPAENVRGVVIVCHGYPMNREEMLPHAQLLHDAGYATLLFDFRAHGESEGDLCSVGYHEVEDLLGAVDYLQSRPDTADLGVGALGHSLGGAVGIMAAARDERIRAVVAEAAFPTLQHALDARCRAVLGPAGPAVSSPIRWWARRWFPVQPHEVAPIRDICHISPRAVLIIQGQRDLLVRWQDAVAMYEAAQEPRALWLLPKSGHARCLTDAPEEYARRITAFFHAHLANR